MLNQPTTDIWEPTDRERELLFAELGLCLYLYQSIELRLKLLLPHLVIPGADNTSKGEGFKNWRVLLDSKETLGPLVKLLAERTATDNTVLLESTLRRLVDERNEVVHHFASQSFSRFSTPEEYAEACKFLTSRRLFAIPLFEMLQALSEQFVSALQNSREDYQSFRL